ncbi:MAG: hypothetical protein ACLRQF_19150 [Thomasclavelia ramosa]
MQTRINEKVASFTENLTTSLEEYAKQYGYETEQEYIDGVLTLGVKQTMLKENILKITMMTWLKNTKLNI